MKTLQHKAQRVAVLIDVQNLYYSAKHLYNTKVNFREILREAVGQRLLVRAIAYVIKTDIKEESVFHEALEKIGIEVKQKQLQIFYGGAKKGDWDIGIAMDAIRLSSKVDTVVLVSGDGDFKDLIIYLKTHGCRTEALAFGKTSSVHLRSEVDGFVDMDRDLRRFLLGAPKFTGSAIQHKDGRYKEASTQQKDLLPSLGISTAAPSIKHPRNDVLNAMNEVIPAAGASGTVNPEEKDGKKEFRKEFRREFRKDFRTDSRKEDVKEDRKEDRKEDKKEERKEQKREDSKADKKEDRKEEKKEAKKDAKKAEKKEDKHSALKRKTIISKLKDIVK